ncbi:L,D-transpeptidase [Leptolyngbya sp. 7M]|uniref:L,D-transpeptidase n=1 Tax=Leptolyngbya sp. 7M TaxID=2812896 RepID=UPI001B8B6528|nr:L,D-transpeptidase [Leptolyngbya sp. 7M]QYO67828.1 L,D-transpeptidase [Leptolyngbya sp. 7M]
MFLKFGSGFAKLPSLIQNFSFVLCAVSVWLISSQATYAQSVEITLENSGADASLAAASNNSEWIEAWVNDLKQSNQRWIQVNLAEQRLTAWEGNTPVFSIAVSTGRASDATPTGVYAIETKYRGARMQGESQGKQYDIPDVPYTMYFSGSYAIHGAYWHDSFGDPVSSGCINVPVEGAAWLFDWANMGTPVVVQD